MTLSMYDSVRDVPSEAWDRLVPPSRIFVQRNYLQVLEDGHPGTLRFLLARKADDPVAVFIFQKVQLHGEDLRPYSGDQPEAQYTWPLAQTLVRFVRDRLHLLHWPLLTTGSPLAADEPGFVFSPALPAGERQSLLLAAIREAAGSLRGIRGYLLAGQAPLNQGYHRVPAEPDMVLRLPPEWKSFENYLDALQSKYRVHARRMMRTAEQLQVEELQLSAIRKGHAVWNALYRQVVEQAGFNLETLHPDYFIRLKEVFAEEFRFFAWYNESRVAVAFHTAFLRDDVLHAHFIGLDYSANRDFRIYPAMLYRYIELALESGVRLLHLGRTAPEIKSSVGAEPVPNHYLFRHERPFIQSLIGPALREARIPEWIRRQPFREEFAFSTGGSTGSGSAESGESGKSGESGSVAPGSVPSIRGSAHAPPDQA